MFPKEPSLKNLRKWLFPLLLSFIDLDLPLVLMLLGTPSQMVGD
jgi:hypothetical protein